MDGFPVTTAHALMSVGVSFGLAGVCYYLYGKSLTRVDKLKGAPRFSVDGQLKDHLKEIPVARLQYAVIEGTVQPLDKPLTSHFNKAHIGVLQKYTLTENIKVWNRFLNKWIDSTRVVHQRETAVPFVLVGPDETTVKVLKPLNASGAYMQMTYYRFHQGINTFSDFVGELLCGEKIDGQLETEEMLKVATTLTGVGKLVLEKNGCLTFGPPDEAEYILSLKDFDSLLSEHTSMTALWKRLAVACTLAGSAVLLWVIWRYYSQVKIQREREAARNYFQNMQTDTTDRATDNPCVICFNRTRDCSLLDCGHVCCCYMCYDTLPQKRCPICRQTIRRVVNLYNV